MRAVGYYSYRESKNPYLHGPESPATWSSIKHRRSAPPTSRFLLDLPNEAFYHSNELLARNRHQRGPGGGAWFNTAMGSDGRFPAMQLLPDSCHDTPSLKRLRAIAHVPAQ